MVESFLVKLQACVLGFIKKRLKQRGFCEIYKIFKNICFYRTPPVTASVDLNMPAFCVIVEGWKWRNRGSLLYTFVKQRG